MLKKHLFLSLLMAVSAATVSAETHHAHWSYTGENDAAHWGDLSEDFAVCKTGKQQSPVDFSTTKAVKRQTTGIPLQCRRLQSRK